MSLDGAPQTLTDERHLNGAARLATRYGSHFEVAATRSAMPAPCRLGRYDRLARLFHWLFACVILYLSIVGYALGRISNGETREFLSHLNMSLATLLILLFPLRLLWKVVRVEPPPLPGVSVMQSKLAHGVHAALYMIILAVLLSGYLMVPRGYAFFGYPVPTPFEQGPLTDALFLFHRGSCAVLVGLVAVHVLAVVKHQLIERRNILGRML